MFAIPELATSSFFLIIQKYATGIIIEPAIKVMWQVTKLVY